MLASVTTERNLSPSVQTHFTCTIKRLIGATLCENVQMLFLSRSGSKPDEEEEVEEV